MFATILAVLSTFDRTSTNELIAPIFPPYRSSGTVGAPGPQGVTAARGRARQMPAAMSAYLSHVVEGMCPRMKAVGLQPSSTGAVGGKETGQHMTHYVIPDGPFACAYAKLAATGWKLNLQSAQQPGRQNGTSSKTKFTCLNCGQNAWGKPDLAIDCEPCKVRMPAAA